MMLNEKKKTKKKKTKNKKKKKKKKKKKTKQKKTKKKTNNNNNNNKKKTQKKKKISTTKLGYRSSEDRSSSRQFMKCRNYDGKTPRIIRHVNILIVIPVEQSEDIHLDIHRSLKNSDFS